MGPPELADAALIAVAMVFFAAGVLKLRDLDAPAYSLNAVLPMSPKARRLAVAVLAVLEVLAALLLLLPGSILFAIPSVLLLGGFTVYLLLLWRRNPALGCGCLGDFGVAGSAAGLMRNAGLAVLLTIGLTAGTDDLDGWSLIPATELALLVIVVPEGVATLRGLVAIPGTR